MVRLAALDTPYNQTRRAADNPLDVGGSQGPLLLPKAEDTCNVGHVSQGSKSDLFFFSQRNFYARN
jgi:hypothetical protein